MDSNQYQSEVLTTLSNDGQYFGDYVDNTEFQRDLFGFVTCAARIEKYKKQIIYGKNIPRFPTINPVRADDMTVLHAKLGIAGEAGELFDAETKEDVRNEGGDLLWYLSVLFTQHGLTFEEVMQANIDKLRLKYKSGSYTREEALNPRIR